jgi:hypothetical protein
MPIKTVSGGYVQRTFLRIYTFIQKTKLGAWTSVRKITIWTKIKCFQFWLQTKARFHFDDLVSWQRKASYSHYRKSFIILSNFVM